MTNDLVSIIIPAYNSEKWIKESIESALHQTWKNREIIIIDDGSTDSTYSIAKTFTAPKVHVVTQDNSGASAARNHGLSLAQGDYIQWLDADDVLACDKIQKQIQNAEPGRTSTVLLSGAWGCFYNKKKNVKIKPDLLWNTLTPGEWLYRKIRYNLWMAIETWLVSRNLTEKAGPWNENIYRDNDGEYFLRVLSIANEIRFVPEAFVSVRRSNVGISHSQSLDDRKLESLIESNKTHIDTLLKIEDSERTRSACLLFLNRWAYNYYEIRPDLYSKIGQYAEKLGGTIKRPELPIKYRLFQYIMGYKNTIKTINYLKNIINNYR